jgi:hypothetical protein
MSALMMGIAVIMGLAYHETDVKLINWEKAIMILTNTFFLGDVFMCPFVVCMTTICHLNYKVVVCIVLAFVMGFCYGVIVWFIRAITFKVHGVSGVLIFLIVSVIFHSCDWY